MSVYFPTALSSKGIDTDWSNARSNMILVKSVAPSPESLGGTFGLSVSIACIARAVGPSFVSCALTSHLVRSPVTDVVLFHSALFAWSIDTQFMAGNFVWVVMVAVAVLGVVVNRRLAMIY